jgi:small subunit ribosomal protein S1
MKQLQSNPWEKLELEYPVGREMELKVIKLLPAAAILELREGLDAYLPISEMSWTQHYEQMKDALELGQMVKVKVLQVSGEERRVRVGVKQLESNPWDLFKLKAVIEAVIKEKRDTSWIATVGDVEAIIPRSQVATSAYGTFEEANGELKVGDTVKAIVQKVEPRKREVVLSLREFFKNEEKGEISQYMASQKEESQGYNPFSALKKD